MTGRPRSLATFFALAWATGSAEAQVGVFQDVLRRFIGEGATVAVPPGTRKRLTDRCRHPAKVSHDIPIHDLVHVSDRPESDHGDDPLVKGLAVLDYGYGIELSFVGHGDATLSCLRLVGVHVVSGTVAPEVWVSPDLDRCERDITLAHEIRHVTHYQDHLIRFREMVDHELALRLHGRNWTWVPDDGDAAEAQARLTEELTAIVETLNWRSRRQAFMLDERLDSPESYGALHAPCRERAKTRGTGAR